MPRRLGLWIAVCTTVVMAVHAPVVSAFDVDFHYYAVCFLLLAKGYPAAEADSLASFSQYIDDNARTEPLHNTASTRARFHFAGASPGAATRRQALEARDALIRAFNRYPAGLPDQKYDIGAALHLFADTFSHEGFTAWWSRPINCRLGSVRPCIGHADTLEAGHFPDHPHAEMARALEAARELYALIPPHTGATPVPWAALESELRTALDASDAPGSVWQSWTFTSDPSAQRVQRLQDLIRRRFQVNAVYDKGQCQREKKPFERAVNR